MFRIFSVILFWCTVLTDCIAAENSKTISTIKIESCWFEREPDWPNATCGVLSVPENYAKPVGKIVQLPFIEFAPFETDETGIGDEEDSDWGFLNDIDWDFLKESSESNAEDRDVYPLLVTGGGGPGYPLGIGKSGVFSVSEYAWYTWAAVSVYNGRSLILLENRGVGSSEPRLDCDEVEVAELKILADGLSSKASLDRVMAAYHDCRVRLVSEGVQLNQYNVTNAARDIEELRLRLRRKKLNVYGVSYGTRVALMYERLFPASVRTLILDGIFPFEVRSHEEIAMYNYKTFANLFSLCRTDDSCDTHFGNSLEAEIKSYLTALEKSPITIRVTHPQLHTSALVTVTPHVVVSSMLSAAYDESEVKRLPLIIRSILSGATDYLSEIVREHLINDLTIYSLDEGAYASYACYDEIPFSDFKIARSNVEKYPIQGYVNRDYLRFDEQLCELWNVKPAAAEIKLAKPISVPVLLYSGELDPATPPEWSKILITSATTVWSKVWPGVAHGVFAVSACADRTAARFLNDPFKDPFTDECVEEEKRIVFELH